jgi:uncharacterized protein (TIGR03083 family)
MGQAPEHRIASVHDTSLSPESYLRHLRSDGARLHEAATDLTVMVPSCPAWSVSDLVAHVAAVYSHKTATLVSGEQPEPGDWATEPPAGVDVLTWFEQELAALASELTAREAHTSCWTWWPPDQSVGFWHRRMAQETLVHRWDAELAAGSTTALDPELATDGVDEVLGWLGWEFDEPAPGAAGQTVLVRTPGLAWTVTLDPRTAVVAAATAAAEPGAAVIEGSPEQLLLHLWGRRLPDPVTQAGDPTALRLLAERLSLVR